jgi:FtsP/CotA-like multicopper oxidase with cupredoxin domain
MSWLLLAGSVATLAVSVGTRADGFSIPTGLPSSPLFGAREFSQKLLMFEEFGTLPLSQAPGAPSSFGLPSACDGFPSSTDIDAVLGQTGLYPYPTKSSNASLPNPWEAVVKRCVPEVLTTKLEGRPPGLWFEHQRWEEFFPKSFFQSVQTGARVNGGARDGFQRHGYKKGEFGPGGLYHNAGTTLGTVPKIHPNMPTQDPHALWTFDGTFPPKLLMARYGEPILFRHHNGLPIDQAANFGFGSHTISTHEHNGHNPAESDGYANAHFYPGEFYDYHWPMILAGHDSVNTGATDPRAGSPDGAGGIHQIPGDARETMSTHWFHDHMLDFTAQNVYKGNAAMMNYYSSIDRGREPRSTAEASGGTSPGYACHYANASSPNLCLPSGTALDWGNRDYDVNLLLADKAWDQQGQLAFNIFNSDGFLGDRMTVNWLWKPYMEVRARRYRFRILNGSVSRYMKIALVNQAGARVPFHLVANDGNLMEHAVPFPNAQSSDLPSHAIAERYDIIVDFSQAREGDKIYLVNLMEHKDGKGPSKEIPLADVLAGRYVGDPGVGKFLEFRVKCLQPGQKDLSMNPADYVVGKKKMVSLPGFSAAELQNAKHRTFEFGRSEGTDSKPWTIKTDDGRGLGMDPHLISAAPQKETVEIWHLKNGGNGWAHPVHIHFEEGQILQRGGQAPPVWEQWARKDVYRLGDSEDSTSSVDVAIRFREFAGTYMEHCHNTQHEDKAMLMRWDIEHPGQTIAIPAPMPEWNDVEYEESSTLPTARRGTLP